MMIEIIILKASSSYLSQSLWLCNASDSLWKGYIAINCIIDVRQAAFPSSLFISVIILIVRLLIQLHVSLHIVVLQGICIGIPVFLQT